MTGLPVFPQGADDPDGGGYKGRRAEQDAAATAAMASDPLGGVAGPSDAPDPPGQPVASVGQDAAFDTVGAGFQAGHPHWGGPPMADLGGAGGAPYDPIGQVGEVVQVGRVGAGAGAPDPAALGADYGQPDGSEYPLGAVYGPGAGSPAGGVAMPADASIPPGYLSPVDQNRTTLAGLGGDAGTLAGPPAAPHSSAAAAPPDPVPPPGPPSIPPPNPSLDPGPVAGGAGAPAPPSVPGTSPDPSPAATDDVSFHPSNLDAMLSGQPVAPVTGPPVAGPGAEEPQGVQVSVDGSVVSSGDGGMQVSVGPDGAATVTLDPAQGAGAATGAGAAGPVVGSGLPGGSGHGPHAPAQPGQQPGDPAGQVVHGTGSDPANVRLTVDHATMGDVPVQVVRNADGSVDIRLSGAGADGHDVDVHVPQGRDVDVTLARDGHGDLLVHTDVTGGDHTGGPQPGSPLGGAPQHDRPQPGGPRHGDPGGQDGRDPTGAVHGPPTGAPRVPAGGGGAPTGSGGLPGGGIPGGGVPGGGAVPGGGGGQPGGTGTGGLPPGTAPGTGTVKANPQAISRLGTDLTNQAGPMLDSAHQKAGNITVGFPAFGVLGLPLNLAHDQVRQTAQSYLRAGRNQLDSWRTALNQTASNYRNAEDSSTISDG